MDFIGTRGDTPWQRSPSATAADVCKVMTTKHREHLIGTPAAEAEADERIRVDSETDMDAYDAGSQRLKEEAAMEAERENITIIDNSEAFLEAFAARYGLRRDELNAKTIADIIRQERAQQRREFELLGIKQAPEGYFEQLQRDRPRIIASIMSRNYPDPKFP